MKKVSQFLLCFLAFSVGIAGCVALPEKKVAATIRYVGSSTVAIFIRSAEPIYQRAIFQMDTESESEGGEKAILEGRADLAGIAKKPRKETLQAGIAATLIGRDAIAVVVNEQNPLTDLSHAQLRSIFTGKVKNWKELGGPNLPVLPYIVGPESATQEVFREIVLNGQDYQGCRVIRPDKVILDAVANEAGAIGQISFSFLRETRGIRAISIQGEEPSITNFNYPIARPLFLLWREGNIEVEDFVTWTQTQTGQQVVLQNFVGIRVLGSVEAIAAVEKSVKGRLVVYTETYPVYDGGIYYYPHRPYDILTRHGKFIRHIQNHRGENDENSSSVELLPRVYLLRLETSGRQRPELFITIESGKTTEVNAEDLLRK